MTPASWLSSCQTPAGPLHAAEHHHHLAPHPTGSGPGTCHLQVDVDKKVQSHTAGHRQQGKEHKIVRGLVVIDDNTAGVCPAVLQLSSAAMRRLPGSQPPLLGWLC